MRHARTYRILGVLVASLVFGITWLFPKQSVRGAANDDFIEGTVISSKGPEAGVWVIAETKDLPTKFAKIVVTDERGKYAIPELPNATYQVFVRGYRLVDSARVSAKTGQHLDLKATVAPDAKTAAVVYPPNYWLALMDAPEGSNLVKVRASCLQCHQIGDKATREIPAALGKFSSSLEAWDHRTQVGPVGKAMGASFQGLGDDRKKFAEWTDKIAAGAVPKEVPPRPTGIERNLVISMWDWATPTDYLHDESATTMYNPSANANGLVFGVSNSQDIVVWLDPKNNTVGQAKIPSDATGMQKMNLPSPYWGTEEIWQPVVQARSSAADEQGRVWFSGAYRGTLTGFGGGASKGGTQPAFCQPGSNNKFAEYFPMPTPSGKQVGMYDPRTGKFIYIDTCFTTDHNQLAPDGSIFFGQRGVVGWINVNTWDKTHNDEASQGWGPAVLDTNGDGKITKPWTEPNQPIDPKLDHRIEFGCYGMGVGPDGSAYCAGGGSQLLRFERGPNPPETFKAEIYDPPPGITGGHGVDVGSDGLVWNNWLPMTTFTSFDRRKCKVVNGPTATGPHCPEGWTAYRKRDQEADKASIFYLTHIDRDGVLGLGKNTVFTGFANSDALLALVPETGKWVTLRVPYPMGFFPRSADARIDNPRTGWKGRGLWTNSGTYIPWHQEGGKGVKPSVVKFQLRPDPLAK